MTSTPNQSEYISEFLPKELTDIVLSYSKKNETFNKLMGEVIDFFNVGVNNDLMYCFVNHFYKKYPSGSTWISRQMERYN